MGPHHFPGKLRFSGFNAGVVLDMALHHGGTWWALAAFVGAVPVVGVIWAAR